MTGGWVNIIISVMTFLLIRSSGWFDFTIIGNHVTINPHAIHTCPYTPLLCKQIIGNVHRYARISFSRKEGATT